MASRNSNPYTPSYSGGSRGPSSGGSRQGQPAPGVYRPQGQRQPDSRQSTAPARQPQRNTAPPPARRNAPPAQTAYAAEFERPKRELILFAVILFGIPLIGFISLFFQPFLWVLSIVSLVCLVAVLFCQCFTKNIRMVICGILLVMTILGAVAANDMTPSEADFPTYGTGTDPLYSTGTAEDPYANANNPAFVASPLATDPLSDPNTEGQQEADLYGTGMEGMTEGQETDPMAADPNANSAPLNEAIYAAQTALTNYLQQWKDRNFEEMVRYTTPSWRSGQTAPQQQLYWNHNWWVLNDWSLSTQTTSPTADSVTFKVIANLAKSNSTQSPAQMEYNAIVFKDAGAWYVDPDSLRSGIAITADAGTAAGEGAQTAEGGEGGIAAPETVGTPDNTQLWYNSDGGKYYHAEEKCSSIGEKYYDKMKAFAYGELSDDTYKNLKPCATCNAPKRP